MNPFKYLLLFALTVVVASCSSDDEVTPEDDLEEVTFSFMNKDKIMEIPDGLASASDPYASVAVSYLNSANTLANYLSYFALPQDAQVTRSRIVPSNGRSKAGDYRVYIWSNPQQESFAYQLGDHGSFYTFEIMVKEPGKSEWLLILSGEEKKDEPTGFMKIYNTYSEDPSEVIAHYEWSKQGDVSNFVYTYQQTDNYSTSVIISMNEETGAGNIDFLEDGQVSLEINWDAAGNGTWIEYNSEAQIVNEGSWTN